MPLARDTDITSGHLRGVTGRLERAKLNAATTSDYGTGSTQINYGASSSANPDGSAVRAALSTTAALGGRAMLRDIVYGRVIGIRINRQNNVALQPFDVIIDGAVYPVEPVRPRFDNLTTTVTDMESLIVVAEGLEDRAHSVAVMLSPSAAAAKSLEVYGWLVESGRGYVAPAPIRSGGLYSAPTTLTASAVAVSPTLPVIGMTFYNSDATQRIVTLYNSGNPYRTVKVPAGESVSIDFPSPRTVLTMTWKADAASVVTAWTENI